MPLLAFAFSLALHAAAFAALLVDWRRPELDEPVLSVELVIVASPLESQTVEEAKGEPVKEEPPPQEAPAAPVEAAAPPPPVVEPAPAPPPPEPPKVVKKIEPPRPAPRPQPAPRAFEPPINLNPGLPSEAPQQARAPSRSESANAFSVLHGPIPPYPALARSRGQEGRVVLDVTIGLDGVPSNVMVARSSGAALLDESALNTVKAWRFRNESGRVLNVTVPIVFELRSTAGR